MRSEIQGKLIAITVLLNFGFPYSFGVGRSDRRGKLFDSSIRYLPILYEKGCIKMVPFTPYFGVKSCFTTD